MKYLYILLAVCLCSCVTQKKCAKFFPPGTDTKDSVVEKETITYRDTTIVMPGDTVVTVYTMECPEAKEIHDTVRDGSSRLTVDFAKGKLTTKCDCDARIQSLVGVIR